MIYLIDTENVGNAWLEVLIEEEEEYKDSDNQIMIMYTNHSPKLDYDEIGLILRHFSENIEMKKCHCGKPNALDFQIVAMVAVMARENADESFTIVSNDTGFDTAIQLYKDAGIQVERREVPKRAEKADADIGKTIKLSNTQLKELRDKQKKFLTNRCHVPKTMAEQVRKWLEKGVDCAEKGLKKSKAKAFKSDTKAKSRAIEGIKKNYGEYEKITG